MDFREEYCDDETKESPKAIIRLLRKEDDSLIEEIEIEKYLMDFLISSAAKKGMSVEDFFLLVLTNYSKKGN